MHVYCSDHLLQVSSRLCSDKATVTSFGECSESVKKARDVVSFINKSTQAVEERRQKQQTLDFCPNPPGTFVSDVVTCWWSTQAIVDCLLWMKPAIDVMAKDDQLGYAVLDAADWQNLKVVMQVLEPFKTAQMFLESDKYIPLSWALPAIKKCRVKLAKFATDQEESARKTLASNPRQDFEQCEGHHQFPQFSQTVRRGHRNREIWIYPADDDSKEGIKNRVIEIMKDPENIHISATHLDQKAQQFIMISI